MLSSVSRINLILEYLSEVGNRFKHMLICAPLIMFPTSFQSEQNKLKRFSSGGLQWWPSFLALHQWFFYQKQWNYSKKYCDESVRTVQEELKTDFYFSHLHSMQRNTYSVHDIISIIAVNYHFRQKWTQPKYGHNAFNYGQIVLQNLNWIL